MSTATAEAQAPPTRFRVVLFEGDGSQPLSAELRSGLVASLLTLGCHVSAVRAGGAYSPTSEGVLVVLGDFLEAKPEQMDGDNGVTVYFRQVAGKTAEELTNEIEALRQETGAAPTTKWKPWFPVIDYDRCTNCMQCLSFCLFDVYGVSQEGKIQVQNQNKCKTDCPACSRVCPEVAILFPKYRHGPINGDVVSEDDLRRESMKVDISALLGGDIYQALRDRSEKAKSRFAKERDSDKALAERKKCLVKLGEKFDIPVEAFEALPSIDEIREKAANAQSKAEAALKANANN